MSDKQNRFDLTSLPPRLPQNRQELDRAIHLLGCRKYTEFTPRAQDELIKLIGIYPTKEEATLWKRILRRACQDVIQQANERRCDEKDPE